MYQLSIVHTIQYALRRETLDKLLDSAKFKHITSKDAECFAAVLIRRISIDPFCYYSS